MSLDKETRNKMVTEFLNDFYKKASAKDFKINESEYKDSLDKLFTTTTWGYREILLVIIIAMNLDTSYKATEDLYKCKPRAIFEGPIKEFFIKKKIPHRQSGPLNIAKATVGLTRTWAAHRQPADIAYELLKIIEYIESDKNKIEDVGISLMQRFILLANEIKSFDIKIEPTSDPDFIYNLCKELIVNVPDGGNTPQKIVAFLLKNYHSSRNTGIIITGGEDRASTTSTTSKKPGDINEEAADGYIYKVYEITVKPFDLARIRDSYNCVSTYNNNNSSDIHEIVVICRKEDCPSDIEKTDLHGYIGNYTYQDIRYYYWDIFEWIANLLQMMTSCGRSNFYNDLANYISEINTAEKVKKFWKQLHEQ